MAHRSSALLLVLIVFLIVIPAYAQDAQPGAPGVGDSLYPGFGNGGYDVEHYALDLTINPDTNMLTGVATITATATQTLSSFNLDLIGFEGLDIQVDGAPAEFARDGQELTITPASPLDKGSAFTTVIRYAGSPEQFYSVAFPALTGWVIYDAGSFVLSEPDGAANFFPVNDHPLDKATYSLSVTVPDPYTVAMNGVVTDIIDNGDTTTTISEVNQPMASYLVTINIAQFDLVEDVSASGVPIRNYFEEGVSADLRAGFDRQADMIDFYESLFGAYPFDVYGAVVVNTETGSALETQTLSIFGTDALYEDDPQESENVVAHELAHQWFGDSVTLADWRDIWLHESWATYCEGLWLEHTQGRAVLDAWVQDTYDYIDGEIDALTPPGNPPAADLFTDSVYYWGALGLHALRLEVGDDAFFEIARTWLERYEYSNASTADFIAVVNEVTGDDYTGFFDQWLYGETLPELP